MIWCNFKVCLCPNIKQIIWSYCLQTTCLGGQWLWLSWPSSPSLKEIHALRVFCAVQSLPFNIRMVVDHIVRTRGSFGWCVVSPNGVHVVVWCLNVRGCKIFSVNKSMHDLVNRNFSETWILRLTFIPFPDVHCAYYNICKIQSSIHWQLSSLQHQVTGRYYLAHFNSNNRIN